MLSMMYELPATSNTINQMIKKQVETKIHTHQPATNMQQPTATTHVSWTMKCVISNNQQSETRYQQPTNEPNSQPINQPATYTANQPTNQLC
jgi:hypothetical protein